MRDLQSSRPENEILKPVPKSDWRDARISEAHAFLLKNGLPHARDEYWRYTPPSLLNQPIEPGHAALPLIKGVALKPNTPISTENIRLEPLSAAENPLFGRLVEKAHKNVSRPMAELILTRAEGAYVQVSGAAGVFVLDHDLWDESFYLGLSLEPNAQMTLIEIGRTAAHRQALFEIELGEGARLSHVRILPNLRDSYLGYVFAELSKNSDFRSLNLMDTGQFRRIENIVDLIGENAHTSISGASLQSGSSHHDNTVFITHTAPHCTSRQLFRPVLGAGALSVFQGKILVEDQAQKTDAYQMSKGLFLNEGGEYLTKPELEIYADDVRCSHGAAVSGLDPDSLFYLNSRGINSDMARRMLVRSFMDEPLAEIEDKDTGAYLAALLDLWIEGHDEL